MNIEIKTEENTTTLALHGHFVFGAHRTFRSAAEQAIREPAATVDVDMSGVAHLDSAALGMLLILNERAKLAGKNVMLSNSRGEIREILDITRMERNFEIV